MDNQLQRQIQEEIDQEARVERKINNGLKRVLKKFRQYKLVNTIDEGDIALIFDKRDIEHFNVILVDDEVKEKIKNDTNQNYVIFFIKHKNNRNSKIQALADISKKRFVKTK